MKKIINIGLIGAGYWGKNILNVLKKKKNLNIHVYDTNKSIKKHRLFKETKIYFKFNEFINKDIDLLFVAVPTSQHFNIVNKVIKCNKFKRNKVKSIFVEKPFCENADQLKKLIEKNKTHKIDFMIGYIYRFNNKINYIKNLINLRKRNNTNQLKNILIERSNLGPVRTDVSCVWDLTSHDISIVDYILGGRINVTTSFLSNFFDNKIADMATVFLKNKNINIEIKSSWISAEKVRKFTFLFEKDMIVFDEIKENNQICIYKKYAKINPKNPKEVVIRDTSRIYPKISGTQPLDNEIEYFINCFVNNKKIIPDINYAYKITKILEIVEKKQFKIH